MLANSICKKVLLRYLLATQPIYAHTLEDFLVLHTFITN